MSDAESTMEVESQEQQPKQQEQQPQKPRSLASASAYSIWPPTDRTRDAVVERLIETLTTPSPLSRRYGTLSADAASAEARLIEQDAFAASSGSAATEESSSGTGMKILQIYSKEISKRMLEVVKAKSAASAAENGAASETAAGAEEPAAVDGENVKIEEEVKTEST